MQCDPNRVRWQTEAQYLTCLICSRPHCPRRPCFFQRPFHAVDDTTALEIQNLLLGCFGHEIAFFLSQTKCYEKSDSRARQSHQPSIGQQRHLYLLHSMAQEPFFRAWAKTLQSLCLNGTSYNRYTVEKYVNLENGLSCDVQRFKSTLTCRVENGLQQLPPWISATELCPARRRVQKISLKRVAFFVYVPAAMMLSAPGAFVPRQSSKN